MKSFLIFWLTLLIVGPYGVAHAMEISKAAQERAKQENLYTHKGELDANLYRNELERLMDGQIFARQFEDYLMLHLHELCDREKPNALPLKCFLQSLYKEFDEVKIREKLQVCTDLGASDLDYIEHDISLHTKMKKLAMGFIENPFNDAVESFFDEAQKIFFQLKGREVAWLHLKYIQLLAQRQRAIKMYEVVHLKIVDPLQEILLNTTTEASCYERALRYFHLYAQTLYTWYTSDASQLAQMREELDKNVEIENFQAIDIAYEMMLHVIIQTFAEASCKVKTPKHLQLVYDSIKQKLDKANENKIKMAKEELEQLGGEFAKNLLNTALEKEWMRTYVYEKELGYQKLWELMDDMGKQPSGAYDETFFTNTWYFLQVLCKSIKRILEPEKKSAEKLSAKQQDLFKVRFCLLLLDTSTKIKNADQKQATYIIDEYKNKLEELKKQQDNLSP